MSLFKDNLTLLQTLSLPISFEIKQFLSWLYKHVLRQLTGLAFTFARKCRFGRRATYGKMAGENFLVNNAITSGGLTKPSWTWRAETKAIAVDWLPGRTARTLLIAKTRLAAIKQSTSS